MITTQELMLRIDAYQIDDPESSFKFSDRLARENMWTKEYTMRVVREYKRFMFLCCVCPPVTPSVDVDECWHLHMIYTRDYWKHFCKEVLNSDIHHGPTRGGVSEDNKYLEQYQKTILHYWYHFKESPPDDIWPPEEIRFAPNNVVRIDLNKHWVIPVGDSIGLYKVIKQFLKFKLWI